MSQPPYPPYPEEPYSGRSAPGSPQGYPQPTDPPQPPEYDPAPSSGSPAPSSDSPAPSSGFPAPSSGFPASSGYPAPSSGFPPPESSGPQDSGSPYGTGTQYGGSTQYGGTQYGGSTQYSGTQYGGSTQHSGGTQYGSSTQHSGGTQYGGGTEYRGGTEYHAGSEYGTPRQDAGTQYGATYPPPGSGPAPGATPPPPGTGPAALAAPPPKKKSSALKIVLIVVAVIAVLCVGGIGVAFFAARDTVEQVFDATKITVVEPEKLGGRAKVTDPTLQATLTELNNDLSKVPGATGSVGAAYGDLEKQDLVLVAAASSLAGSAESRFSEFTAGMNEGGMAIANLTDTEPGPLGGIAKCGDTTDEDVSMAICVWSDNGSVGMFVMPFKKKADLEKEFVTLRGQVEQKR